MILVALQNVWKTYSMGEVEVHALRGVDFQIEAGQFVVFLGPSGCGKTTMLNMIGGMDTPTSGHVLVGGEDIAGYDDTDLTSYRRETVGFVFQFFNLVPTLTARENVQLAADLVANPRRVQNALEAVGLGPRADHFPSELSGGEQQRVAIARALVKNPPLLLADEPTGELDIATGKQVLTALRQVVDEESRTVLMVTHNSVIADMADVVVRMRDGRIESQETVSSPVSAEDLRW
jgi:putative ABC transport system ATP-binding protein